jgi:hypothetical protein
MVVMNKDGDFAILKAKWVGFTKRVQPKKGVQRGKPGSAGKLQVEAFNLLKNTVQKFDLPGAEGSTHFVVGGKLSSQLICAICINIDAQARLPGKRIQCKSTFMAEHIASIFSVATLFVLCNPDKVIESKTLYGIVYNFVCRCVKQRTILQLDTNVTNGH